MRVYKFHGKIHRKGKKPPRFNIKNHISKIIMLVGIIILVVFLICAYSRNLTVKKWIDKNILKKELTNENVHTIEIDSEDVPYIYAYDKYIVTLEKNKLKAYSYTGKKEMDLDISVSKPVFSSNNRFLAVAESYGKKMYLISSQGILWEQSIEGEISRINVNKNGYVSVAITRNKP